MATNNKRMLISVKTPKPGKSTDISSIIINSAFNTQTSNNDDIDRDSDDYEEEDDDKDDDDDDGIRNDFFSSSFYLNQLKALNLEDENPSGYKFDQVNNRKFSFQQRPLVKSLDSDFVFKKPTFKRN